MLFASNGCQVFHVSLPQYLTLSFQRIQIRALRIMFGHEVHYADVLARSGLVTLQYRRTKLCKKLFKKIVDSPLDVLHPLIPFNERPTKDLRNARPYRVKPCKTNRCRDSFINKCAVLFSNSTALILKFYIRSRSRRILTVCMQVIS